MQQADYGLAWRPFFKRNYPHSFWSLLSWFRFIKRQFKKKWNCEEMLLEKLHRLISPVNENCALRYIVLLPPFGKKCCTLRYIYVFSRYFLPDGERTTSSNNILVASEVCVFSVWKINLAFVISTRTYKKSFESWWYAHFQVLYIFLGMDILCSGCGVQLLKIDVV